MGITINLGRPRVSLAKDGETPETTDVIDRAAALFTTRNFVLLGAGIALGIILKQGADIRTLKRTIGYLQEVIR